MNFEAFVHRVARDLAVSAVGAILLVGLLGRGIIFDRHGIGV